MTVMPPPTKLSLIRDETTYPLSDGTILFETPDGPVVLFYLEDSGLGMPPITRFAERGPAQHGETDLGFLWEPRVISYIFAIFAPNTDTSANLERARMMVYDWFRPSSDPISLRYDRAYGDVMQIDGHFTGGLQFATADRTPGTWYQKFNVDIRFPDPTWYDPEEEVFTITPVGWIDPSETFTVPTPVSTSFGQTIYSAPDVEHINTGTWDAYPIIRIDGPFRNPRIYNQSTDEVLDFDGVYIGYSEYIEIDLRHGLKTVVDSTGANRSSWLTDDSDLATWHLQIGENILSATGLSANQDSNVTLTYLRRFVGI